MSAQSVTSMLCAGGETLASIGATQAEQSCVLGKLLVGVPVATVGYSLAAPSAGLGPVAAYGTVAAALPCFGDAGFTSQVPGSTAYQQLSLSDGLASVSAENVQMAGGQAHSRPFAEMVAPGMLLTDASVYPGCSGGALVSLEDGPKVNAHRA
jgi:hypothetical protein